MRVLDRLFKRPAKPAAPEEANPTAALAAPAAEGAAKPVAAPSTAEPAPVQPTRPAALPEQPEVPLRSLQRYRQDPAFRNFMAKAQKKPGAARRPGIPADYLDGDQRPR
jgi:hypothetical protein